ncbi:MAG: hypothetical protein HY744_03475 [Deltaproteobacteria bacterium]|nr:hypothetical protein [Deltaproteobacteria bacterium]
MTADNQRQYFLRYGGAVAGKRPPGHSPGPKPPPKIYNTVEDLLAAYPVLAHALEWELPDSGKSKRECYAQWPLARKKILNDYYKQLLKIDGSDLGFPVAPADFAGQLEPGSGRLYLRHDQALHIYAKYAAWALFLEATDKLKWKLHDMTLPELKTMLASSHYHARIRPTGYPLFPGGITPGTDFQICYPMQPYFAPRSDPRIGYWFLTGLHKNHPAHNEYLLGATQEDGHAARCCEVAGPARCGRRCACRSAGAGGRGTRASISPRRLREDSCRRRLTASPATALGPPSAFPGVPVLWRGVLADCCTRRGERGMANYEQMLVVALAAAVAVGSLAWGCDVGRAQGGGGAGTGCSIGVGGSDGACNGTAGEASDCGSGGNGCADDGACLDGGCGVECAQGETRCDGECVDLASHTANCGGCGVGCVPGEGCHQGKCVPADGCRGGTTDCGGECVDLTSEPNNCGSCGHACDDVGESGVCSSGQCVCDCVGCVPLCGGKCTDTKVDPANCGGCGVACKPGEVCAAGACK